MATSSLFLSHGAPTIALDKGAYASALAGFGRSVSPRSLVVFSGHFQASPPVRIASASRPTTVHDFSGFPEELYAIEYPAPGYPRLADEILALLEGTGRAARLDPTRGWDHGLWAPLRLMFPEAAIPIVEVSLPQGSSPEELLAMGAALAPLHEKGVLLVGSGGIVHNLARVRFGRVDVDPWARQFDDWVAQALESRDIPRLTRYRTEAPHADLAVPTSEHFDPLFVALGYASPVEQVSPIYAGFEHGNISLQSFAVASESKSGDRAIG